MLHVRAIVHRMALYEILGAPELRTPVLVAAFEGWVDAAGVGTAAAAHIAGEGELLARFDAEELLDYRARRPTMDIAAGVMQEMVWPEIVVRHASVGGRDVLVLTGPEPDMRWRHFASSVLDLGLTFGVVSTISLGAIPAAVPHTRPTPVISTVSDPELLAPGDQVPEGILRVPAAAVNLVERAFGEHGIPSGGFWAQVPHYVVGAYAPSVIALVERVSRALKVVISLGSLPEEAQQQRAQLDAMVADRPEAASYLERLESLVSEESVPSGEEIAAEIERFLRQGPTAPGELE